MREFAADLAATGQLRPGLSLSEVADMIWATNSPEFYCLLVQDRGWPPPRYEAWLADCWQRLLLAPTSGDAPAAGLLAHRLVETGRFLRSSSRRRCRRAGTTLKAARSPRGSGRPADSWRSHDRDDA